MTDLRTACIVRRALNAIPALVLCLNLALAVILHASPARAAGNLDFTLHKLDSGKPGPTLLIIGGIQGDEPGGFNAASLIVSRYNILSGKVWVVPNLNFLSIVNRSRGVYGDLNRKFAHIRPTDPDYEIIHKIKAIITHPEVDLILNLHDGSGFYRPVRVDRLHNPDRWGQSIIIDQATLNHSPYGNLEHMARNAAATINSGLLESEHAVHVKNTRTREGDKEMAKTLTYFAINSGTSAFGLEASKSFPTHTRVYYHLRAVEAFMDQLGIRYDRTFRLTANGVWNAINSNVAMALYEGRIMLDLDNPRARIRYVPLKKGGDVIFTPTNPLITVVGTPGDYTVHYGNRRLTKIHPQFFDFDSTMKGLPMVVDGERMDVPFGSKIHVREDFRVNASDECRINVIGFRKAGQKNESGLLVRRKNISSRFSLDRKGDIYRVEAYRDGKFAGMILVDFGRNESPGPFLAARNLPLYGSPATAPAAPPATQTGKPVGK